MPRHAELRPRKLPSGLWRVDVAPSLSPNRKRLKKDFETEARAKTYIGQIKAHHAHPVSLTDEQTRECHTLYTLLPDGLKMPEAVERGLASWQRERTGRTFAAVLDQVLAAKRASGVTERHLGDIRQKAGRFAQDFGERPIASIERGEIREYLAALTVAPGDKHTKIQPGDPLSPESRNCYRRVLGLVFGFALREGFIPSNPVAAVETAKVAAAPVGIFTPDEASRLLIAAREHRYDGDGRPSELSSILPAVALGLFAGLRPEETHPLLWSQIDWERKHIDITKGKTAARPRFVPMSETLLAWLEPYRSAEGRVAPVTLWRTLTKIRAKAGITHWPKDVLRHSFASYSLHLNPDVHALAAIMGNSVAVIHKHYRRPMRAEHAQQFFALLP